VGGAAARLRLGRPPRLPIRPGMDRRRRIGRIIGLGLAAGALTVSATGLGASAVAPARTAGATPAAADGSPAPLVRRSFQPVADTYVNASEPTRNYGRATRLRLDGDPRRRAYLRFDVRGLAGPVLRATLRVYATSTSRRPFSVFRVAGPPWAERAITHATAPAVAGRAVDGSGPVVAARWVALDVTSLVRREGPASMALVTVSATAVALASRESGTPPVLVVESSATQRRAPAGGGGDAPGADLAPDSAEDPAPGDTAPEPDSAPVDPVNTVAPIVAGVPVVGGQLVATPGSWSGDGAISYEYLWSRCDAAGQACQPIAGAEAAVYTLDAADLGATIRVSVTATDASGSAEADSSTTTAVLPAIAPPPPSVSDPVVAAAGDIACDPGGGNFTGASIGTCQMRATSDLLLDGDVSSVLTLGDNQYENNTYSSYLQSFDPTWGRVKPLIHPGIGNHEYLTAGAGGYFQYFGAAAGDPARGYYSFDVGSWHLIALNSNCSKVGGCGVGSAQETWLRADLAAHPAACTLAYWHHPRFSSGEHGSFASVQPLWQALYDAGAEAVLSGHDHDYERFAAQTAAGALDPARGIRQFVVGTGGKNHYPVGTALAHSEVRNDTTYGVLKLTLRSGGYDWRFEPQAGGTFTDAGSAACH
ncbi:MAG: hypothetical protein QOK40_935, partial [Miltoncostaeaceae bacterium]|nr:hypothetical protein [Miltoncostaeaceae bacterium]